MINRNNPIGFFDSGVGGLTVFSEFRKILPNEDCVYFGDTKNMPYGEKTKEQLIEFSRKAFDFFESRKVKAVVMACNTTSATVYDKLKDEYSFKLYPIIQSVAKILAGLPAETIGILATPATIGSHAYANGIKHFSPKKNVVEVACPSWVKIVENGSENTPEALNEIKEKMDEIMKYNPEKIVLGCTHYPYLLKQLSHFADVKLFVNPAKYYVDYIKSDLADRGLLNETNFSGYEYFYTSSSPEKFMSAAGLFYNISVLPEILNLK